MRQVLDSPRGVHFVDRPDEPDSGSDPVRTLIEQLRAQHSALEQANAAVQTVLARVTQDRSDVQTVIAANVDKVIMPLLHSLEAAVPTLHKKTVALVRRNLEEITSPFTDRFSRKFANLTPLEIRLCRMLRDDLSTKEIAQIRHVSPATVARQRERIRRKLGLTGSSVNLTTFLRSQESERSQHAASSAE